MKQTCQMARWSVRSRAHYYAGRV